MSPRRDAKKITRPKLIQAPIVVASARPTCASGPVSTSLKAMLTAAAISAALSGVAVSPRARNVAITLRISTNGNSPIA